MKVWMVWVQGDDTTWIEAAWTDEMTAENHAGWTGEVDGTRKMCIDNGYEMRIQAVNVPGVYELFEIPEVTATQGD